VNPVFTGQVELGPHVRVALVAVVWLVFREKMLSRGRIVNRMAGSAGDVVLGMLRAPDVGAIELFCMTSETQFYDLWRLHHAKGIHHRLDVAARIDMRLTRTMAALAAGPFRRFLAGGNALEMRVLVKAVPDRVMFMTVPASRI